ncbi:MAG: hypothetical protein AAGC56_00685 [Pseudomonadota bacterium]
MVRAVVVAACVLLAGGCVRMTLAWTDLSGEGPAATPPALAAFPGDGAPDPQRFRETVAPTWRAALAETVYGVGPEASRTDIVDRRVLDDAAFAGAGRLIEYRLKSYAVFDDAARPTADYVVDVVLPAGADGPVPVILMETFCPRWDTIPHPGVARPEGARSCEGGFASGIMKFVFGRYIATPPVAAILARGYGVAAIFPGEIVPDDREAGEAALRALSGSDDETRWGAIGVWGWVYDQVAGVLAAEDAVDADRLIAFGHSRYGKAALVAAAFYDQIDGVVAHQSGTGGASLNRGKVGESVGSITKTYPHWFAPAYASFAGREDEMPADQHQLLALAAPRPVLLGNARRDVWSDPNGAFRAAQGASVIYDMFGGAGMTQERLRPYDPTAALSFWIRPGTHGVVEEDWPAFLDFLDAHFGSQE